MAIISINEDVGQRSATWTWSGGNLSPKYTRVWKVQCDDTLSDMRDVLALAGNPSPGPDTIPAIGTAYPSDSSAVCQELDCSEMDGHLIFYATAIYKQQTATGVGSDPTALDWEFSMSFVAVQRPVPVDIDGTATKNSAGELYSDPPVMETYYEPVFNLAKWYSSVNVTTAKDRIGAKNSSAFTLCGASILKGDIRCIDYRISPKEIIGGNPYYKVNISLHWGTRDSYYDDPSGTVKTAEAWEQLILDAGYRFKDAATNELAPIMIDRVEVSSPISLDGNGQPLGEGSYQNVHNKFNTVKDSDMSLWGLPTAIP